MNRQQRRIALQFINEVIEYFESMPMLTDDEEALLGSAEWTKEELTKGK